MRRIRQGAATEAYWESTVRERNAAGADAAALECHRIYELKYDASVQAKGGADYGTLRYYAYSNSTGSTSANAWGGAIFSDTLTIRGASGAGSLNVWVDVDGAITGTIGHPGVYAGAGWSVGFPDNYPSEVWSWDYANNTGRQVYSGYLNQVKPFTFGMPFDLAMIFSAGTGPGVSLANYWNTVTLNMSKSQVLDSNGNPVTGFTVTADSGHNYLPAPPPPPTEPIPEPATMLLLGSGLAGLVGAGRRLRK